MNVKDAETMLKTLSKSTKGQIGEQVLGAHVPNPNEIWATVVAINSKLAALQQSVTELEKNQTAPSF